MKIFNRITIILGMLIIFCVSSAYAAGPGYEEYLNGDKSCPFVWGHQGQAWYIDLNSINVIRHEPPRYLMEGNCIKVDYDDEAYATHGESGVKQISDTPRKFRMFYNYKDVYGNRKMYIDYSSTDTNDWRLLIPAGKNAAGGLAMYALVRYSTFQYLHPIIYPYRM